MWPYLSNISNFEIFFSSIVSVHKLTRAVFLRMSLVGLNSACKTALFLGNQAARKRNFYPQFSSTIRKNVYDHKNSYLTNNDCSSELCAFTKFLLAYDSFHPSSLVFTLFLCPPGK